MSIALGTLPDWIAGVATTGALAAAVLAAKAAFGQVQHMKDQIQHSEDLEKDQRETARRRQASQVAVWIESIEDVPHVLFSNKSELPIYSVTVICHAHWMSNSIDLHYATLGPTDEPRRLERVEDKVEEAAADQLIRAALYGTGRLGLVIKPGSELSKLEHNSWPDLVAETVRVGFAFNDCAGVPWARDPQGELRECGMLGAAIGFLQGRTT